MPYDPTNPTRFNPMASALGQQRGGALTKMGYGGPMPGTPEFQAARAAGETPIRDWAQEHRGELMQNRPQFGHGGMMGGMQPRQPMGGMQGPVGGTGGINPGGMYSQPRPPMQPPQTMGGAPAGFGLPTMPQAPQAPRLMSNPNTGVVPPTSRPFGR